MIPFCGWTISEDVACRDVEPLGKGSSPMVNGAEAKEYMSEKTRGSRGILPRMPHFWLVKSSDVAVAPLAPIDVSLGFTLGLSDLAALFG